jgi:predicted dehydrogenase
MAEKYRIGILGLTHDHIWGNLDELSAIDNAELVAVADPNQPLLAKAEDAHGCTTYADHEEMLDHETLDGVYIYSDNASGAELAVLAAERGLHAMVEKPMAATYAGAQRMMAAAKKNDTRLMINWPFAWWPSLQKAVLMALDGQIGDVWQVRYRAAHAGPKELGCSTYFCDWLFDPKRNGGGAMMDYCCYGALLARVLMGVPKKVYGTTGNFQKKDLPVEDNGTIVMSYESGSAISEGSWTQGDNISSYTPYIFGSEATLMVEPRNNGKLIRADAANPLGIVLDTPEPPAQLQSATAHFLWGLETQGDYFAMCDPAQACDAQQILEAGFKSASSGAEVKLPLDAS